MNPDEIQALLDRKFEQTQKALADAQKNNASKDEIIKLTEAIKAQGQALEDHMESQKKRVVKDLVGQFGDFLKENKSKLEEIKNQKSGEITFIPKVVGDITTGSGTDIDTPPLDVSTDLGSFNLRNDQSLLSLCTISSTNSPSHSYTEMLPKEG
jgi:hypothetical protein